MDVAPGATSLVIRTSQDYRYDNFLSMLQVQCGDLWASKLASRLFKLASTTTSFLKYPKVKNVTILRAFARIVQFQHGLCPHVPSVSFYVPRCAK